MIKNKFTIILIVVFTVLFSTVNIAMAESKPLNEYTYLEYDAMTQSERSAFEENFIINYGVTEFLVWYDKISKDRSDAEHSGYVEDVTTVDVSVLRNGEISYSRLDRALASATDGDVITVIQNTDEYEGASLYSEASVVLNLDGHNISVNSITFTNENAAIVDTKNGLGSINAINKNDLLNQPIRLRTKNQYGDESYLPIYDKDGFCRFYSLYSEVGISNNFPEEYSFATRLRNDNDDVKTRFLNDLNDAYINSKDSGLHLDVELQFEKNEGCKEVVLSVKRDGNYYLQMATVPIKFKLDSKIETYAEMKSKIPSLTIHNAGALNKYGANITSKWYSDTGVVITKSYSVILEKE